MAELGGVEIELVMDPSLKAAEVVAGHRAVMIGKQLHVTVHSGELPTFFSGLSRLGTGIGAYRIPIGIPGPKMWREIPPIRKKTEPKPNHPSKRKTPNSRKTKEMPKCPFCKGTGRLSMTGKD